MLLTIFLPKFKDFSKIECFENFLFAQLCVSLLKTIYKKFGVFIGNESRVVSLPTFLGYFFMAGLRSPAYLFSFYSNLLFLNSKYVHVKFFYYFWGENGHLKNYFKS